MAQIAIFDGVSTEPIANSFRERAEEFCRTAPHRTAPFARRDWGGPLHSLCSYQGKLKPAIAHFLVSWFTKPGDRVLDPLAGVGTIPLEARRQGRIGIANDLSRLADAVCRAKLAPIDAQAVVNICDQLAAALEEGPTLARLAKTTDFDFGLNGPIRAYFHPDTLREVVIARNFFLELGNSFPAAARDVVLSGILHILHGNRPYALSRRSHPVTPFAPTGEYKYVPLYKRLVSRLERVLPFLLELGDHSFPGEANLGDFRALQTSRVDVVITSPPFFKSIRFWSSNWMRLWFAGWQPSDFVDRPGSYLETEQLQSFSPYRDFSGSMSRLLKPGGHLIMHLGESGSKNMASELIPMLEPEFKIDYVGRESVLDTESHGLTDKGTTIAHLYLFATRNSGM